MKSKYKLLVILFIFIIGCIYYTNSYNIFQVEPMKNKENMYNNVSKRCPNMLIEKDGRYALFNSDLAVVPGVNPIEFSSLDEYSEFLDWQKSQKINCPILYLQYTTDTQNNDLIQVKPSLFENDGGTPYKDIISFGKENEEYYEKNKMHDATKDSTPNSNHKYNTNMFQGFDETNQNIGLDTPLDKIYSSNSNKSANPMDTNWGGKKYTESKIKAGDYKGREVYKHNI